jgi:hypothetical protein
MTQRIGAPSSRKISALIVGGFGVLCGVVLLAESSSPGSTLAIVGLVALLEVLCWRAMTMHVTLDKEGVAHRGLLTHERVRWSEARRFAVRGSGPDARLVLERNDGAEMTLSAVMPAVWAPNRGRALEELIAELERARLEPSAVYQPGQFVGGGPARCDAGRRADVLLPTQQRSWTVEVDGDYGAEFEGAGLPPGRYTLAIGLNVGTPSKPGQALGEVWYARTATVRFNP